MSNISLIAINGQISDDKDKMHATFLGFINPLNTADYLGLRDLFYVNRPNVQAKPADWDVEVGPITDEAMNLEALREDITAKRHYAKLVENFGYFIGHSPMAYTGKIINTPVLSRVSKVFNPDCYDRILEINLTEDVWNFTDDGVIPNLVNYVKQSLQTLGDVNLESLENTVTQILLQSSDYFCLSFCEKVVTYQRKSFFIPSNEYAKNVGDRFTTITANPLDKKQIVQVSKEGKTENYADVYKAIAVTNNVCFTDDYLFDSKYYRSNSNVITRKDSTPKGEYFVEMPTYSALKIAENLEIQANNTVINEGEDDTISTQEFTSNKAVPLSELYANSENVYNVLSLEVFNSNVADLTSPYIYSSVIADAMIKHTQTSITPYYNLYPVNNIIESAFSINPETKEPYTLQDIKGYSGKQNTIELYPEERTLWFGLKELVNTGIAIEQNILRYETLREILEDNSTASATVDNFINDLIRRAYNINWAHTGITSTNPVVVIGDEDKKENKEENSDNVSIQSDVPYIVGDFNPETNKFYPARTTQVYMKSEATGMVDSDVVDYTLYISSLTNETLLNDKTLGDGYHDLMLTLSNYVNPYLHIETLLKLLRWGERKPKMLVYNLCKLNSNLYLDIATMTKQPFSGDTTSLTLIPEKDTGITSEIKSVITSTLFSDLEGEAKADALRDAIGKLQRLYLRLDLSNLKVEDGPIDLTLGVILKDRLGSDGVVSPTYTQYSLVDMFSFIRRVESPLTTNGIPDKYRITLKDGKFEDSKGDEIPFNTIKDACRLLSVDGNNIPIDLSTLTLEQLKFCDFTEKEALALGTFSIDELVSVGFDRDALEEARVELSNDSEEFEVSAYSLCSTCIQSSAKYSKLLTDFVSKGSSGDVNVSKLNLLEDYKNIFDNTGYLLRVLAAGRNLTDNPDSFESIAGMSTPQCYAIYNTLGAILQANLVSDGSLASIMNVLHNPPVNKPVVSAKPVEDSKRELTTDEFIDWVSTPDVLNGKYIALVLENTTDTETRHKIGVIVLTNHKKSPIGFVTSEEFMTLRSDARFAGSLRTLSRRGGKFFSINLSTITDIKPILGLGVRLLSYCEFNNDFELKSTMPVNEFIELIPEQERARILDLTKVFLENAAKEK